MILINHTRFGKGEEIIFLHGWGGGVDSFIGLAKQLSNHFKVTLVDFYGHGKTPFPDKVLTLDDYVKSVVDIIQHYKMKSVTLIAHSFGGRVALKLAYKYGYMLDKLILIDSAGIRPRRGLKYYSKVLLHKTLKKLKIKRQMGSADYRKLNGVQKRTFVNIVNEDLTDILNQITLPTLIIWGNKDKETPIYMARKLHRKLCSSGLVVIKEAGHFCYLEKPAKVLIIIRSFLSEG
ncbi:MAG: alpha/beta hydrolase [Clostridia bacterium]|nr:alpha/beta hydrolase [Clostridiales bacterium]